METTSSPSVAPQRIEICRFPKNKRIALTTSWDDGRVYDRRLIQQFNRWGIKGTFNLNSGRIPCTGRPAPDESTECLDACEIAEVYAGHEVAVHTVSHPFPSRLDRTQIVSELLHDRQALEDLVGYPVRGMAYPFGDFDARTIDALRALGFVYARTTRNTDPCFPCDDPLAWPTTMHWLHADKETLPERWKRVYGDPNNVPRYASPATFFVWGHSYECAQRPDGWQKLEDYFAPMGNLPDVWYCTNIELWDYETARQRMVIAANRRSAFNPSGIPVTLNVDGQLRDIAPGQTVKL